MSAVRRLQAAVCEVLEKRLLLVTPQVLSHDFRFNEVATEQAITVTFNVDVGASLSLEDRDIEVYNRSDGVTLGLKDMNLAWDPDTRTAIITFPGYATDGILPDAHYNWILNGAGVSNGPDHMETDYSDDFFFLQADANHNAVVNLQDFNILSTNFGQSPRSFSQGDFSYDGIVDLQDFSILAARFGNVLPDPPASSNTLQVTESGYYAMELHWTPPSGVEYDGFKMYRASDPAGTNFVQIHQFAASTGSATIYDYLDDGLADGSKYSYRVRAYTVANGNYGSTNRASGVTPIPPPANLRVERKAAGQIVLRWENRSTTANQIYVYQATDDGGFGQPTVLSGTVTRLEINNLKPEVEYKFQLKARNSAVNHASILTLPVLVVKTPSAIIGPDSGNEGETLRYTADLTAGSETRQYFWQVTANQTVVATGEGTDFAFVPPDDGGYSMMLSITGSPGGAIISNRVINVANVAPQGVRIDGPSLVRQLNAVVFRSAAIDPAGADDPLQYHWKVFKFDSTLNEPIFVPPTAGVRTDLPTFRFVPPPEDPQAEREYQVKLTVSDGDGGESLAAHSFRSLVPLNDGEDVIKMTTDFRDESLPYPRRDRNQHINALAAQSDGKVVAAGWTYGGAFAVARYTPDLQLDTTFAGDGIAIIRVGDNSKYLGGAHSLVVLPEGKILVAGEAFDLATNVWQMAVSRLTSTGTLDPTFASDVGGIRKISFLAQDDNPPPIGEVPERGDPLESGARAIAIQPGTGDGDYKIIVGGWAGGWGESQAEWPGQTAGGSPDPDYDYGDDDNSLAYTYFATARLHSDGRVDDSFAEEGRRVTYMGSHSNSIGIQDIVVQTRVGGGITESSIIAGGLGNETSISLPTFGMVRYTSLGEVDPSFGENQSGKVFTDVSYPPSSVGQDWVQRVLIQRDGGIVAAGPSGDLYGPVFGGDMAFGVARYSQAGTLPSIAAPDLNHGEGVTARHAALQPDGKVVVSGWTLTSL